MKILKYFIKNSIKNTENKISLDLFKDCNKILDVGCGNCEFLKLDPKRIEGVDIKPEYGLNKGFKVKEGSCLELPYADNSFDGINCSHVIEHLTPKELTICLTEFDRVLKKDGILIISSPLFNQKFYDTPDHIRPYNPKCLSLILCNNRELPLYFNLQKYKMIKKHYRFDIGSLSFWESGFIGLPFLFSAYLLGFKKVIE